MSNFLKNVSEYVIREIKNGDIGYVVRSIINSTFYNLKRDISSRPTQKDIENLKTPYFKTLAELQAARPNAQSGDKAWVGDPFPGTVWFYSNKWEDTGKVPPAEEVNLTEYAKNGGSDKTVYQLENQIRISSRNTDVRETENIVRIKQEKTNGQFDTVEYERETDSIYLAFSSGVLKYFKDNQSSVRCSKMMQVNPGDEFSITACVSTSVPPVVGFDASFEQNRIDKSIVNEGHTVIVYKEGEETGDGYLLKKVDFIVPENVYSIIIQGRNRNHPSYVEGYELSVEKKEKDVNSIQTSVFTTKAESEGFWNKVLKFIQGTIGVGGMFEESDTRIVSEHFYECNTETFSASVSFGYELSIICFDDKLNRLGPTASIWSQVKKDEPFLVGTTKYRIIIRKAEEAPISPSDAHNFQSEELDVKVWDRLVSESYLKNLVSEYREDNEIEHSDKIIAPDIYVGVDITSDYVYNLYDTLLGAYPGIAPDDATSNTNYYRVTKRNMGKDQSDTYDIYAYEFLPLAYKKTVFFTCLLHGTEIITPIGMFELMKHMVNEDTGSPVLKYMRDNVRIVLLPVANPWGVNNKKYGNINGVNPNRNYPYYWNEYVPTGSVWDVKGSGPFSEKETRIIRDIAISLSGELDFMIDYHTGEGWLKEPFYYYDNVDEYLRTALSKAGKRIIADYYAEKGKLPTPETIDTARDLKVYWFNRCLKVPCATIEFGPTLYSNTINDSTQLTWLMWNYLRYWTELFSLPKYASKGNIGIKILTENEYNELPAKSYKTIYLITDKDNAKKIGDVDF